jgi:hypothetical protein
MRATTLLALATLLAACGGSTSTLSENAAAVFKDCEPDALKMAAARHNVQHVFEPCGSNEFKDFAWSPSGTDLYVRNEGGPWIRRMSTGEFYNLPLGKPLGSVAWINDQLIAFPGQGKRGPEINVYDVEKRAIHLISIRQLDADELVRGDAADAVLFLAREQAEGPRSVYRLSANTALVERAWPWLPELDIQAFTYRRGPGIACLTVGAADDQPVVRCHRASDGSVLHEFPGKLRASVSLDGRLIALEGPGEPLKVFKDPEVEKKAPAYMPREVSPASFWVFERTSSKEVLLEGIFGWDFNWYDAENYWGSYQLWGFDDRQTNSNIMVGNLTEQLRALGLDMSAAGKDPRTEG